MWHFLQIKECPIEVLIALCEEIDSQIVTVENHPVGQYKYWHPISMGLAEHDPPEIYRTRNLMVDLELTREQFMARMSLWDAVGVHAIFTSRSLPMRTCDLKETVRHKVLENFDAQLIFGMGDATCHGLSEIRTPQLGVIQRAEEVLEELGKTELINACILSET